MKLFPPIFRTGAAILSPKIDDLAFAVRDMLDGGLDADSLDSAVRLPTASFLEPRSVYAIRTSVNSRQLAALVIVPSRIIGITVIDPANGGWARSVKLFVNGTEEVSLDIETSVNRMSECISPAVVVPQNALLEAQAYASGAPHVLVTIFLDAIHEEE